MGQRLAYSAFGVSDVAETMRFGTDILGLMPDERGGIKRLRMDDRSWRLAVIPSPVDDIIYAGFELDTAKELQARAEKLTKAGLALTDLTQDELVERQVSSGFYLHDPDGLRLEFVTGHALATEPFRSDLVKGFTTGDQGFGHIVLTISDLAAGIAFYETIGLSLSDFITAPMGPNAQLRIAFLHCNPRHHSIAIAHMPNARRLHHFMVELDEVDDVLLGHRRSLAAGIKTGGIGRHPNDMMLSCYIRAPSGFEVEYGWGGRTVEDDDPIIEYDRTSIWGHERAA